MAPPMTLPSVTGSKLFICIPKLPTVKTGGEAGRNLTDIKDRRVVCMKVVVDRTDCMHMHRSTAISIVAKAFLPAQMHVTTVAPTTSNTESKASQLEYQNYCMEQANILVIAQE